MNEVNATPHAELIADLMNPNNPKNDREHAAVREIERLREVQQAVIAGALFDFMGWLTTRDERLVLSSADEASPAVDAITDFAKMRGLSLDDARVQDWHTTPPAALAQAAERNKVAAWMIAQGYATGHGETMEGLLKELERKASFDRAEIWIKRINEAVLAEREACAKVCDDELKEWEYLILMLVMYLKQSEQGGKHEV